MESLEKQEQKRNLSNAVEALNEGHLRNLSYSLFKAGFNELSSDVLRIILTEVTESIIYGSDRDLLSGDIIPNSLIAWQEWGEEILKDPLYQSIGNDLGKLRAVFQEQIEDYEYAAYFYDRIGMLDKAKEMKEKQALNSRREPKANLEEEPLFNMAVQEFRNEFKDAPLLSKEQRAEILNNVSQKIQIALSE